MLSYSKYLLYFRKILFKSSVPKNYYDVLGKNNPVVFEFPPASIERTFCATFIPNIVMCSLSFITES